MIIISVKIPKMRIMHFLRVWSLVKEVSMTKKCHNQSQPWLQQTTYFMIAHVNRLSGDKQEW